jgi:hypothetical protein
MVTLAPMVALFLTKVRCNLLVRGIASRGLKTLIKTIEGPQNTSYSEILLYLGNLLFEYNNLQKHGGLTMKHLLINFRKLLNF